jgi:Lar family restriction alleviation protein
MSEHKACPFCGSENSYIDGDYGYNVFVSCDDCSASGPPILIGSEDNEEDLNERAWSAWNHRAEAREDGDDE